MRCIKFRVSFFFLSEFIVSVVYFYQVYCIVQDCLCMSILCFLGIYNYVILLFGC